ncbi:MULTISPECIES: ThiF family adenylyltransferase [Sinorhizobium]|uniref:ThiF family adenylyltransferase n=1 Tax=Sinorhizobium TaxID=28105 RepID=UPI000FDAF7D0|nr:MULTISPECIES: ThiF family adenylyltransferase [Sinorhizobium]RVJ37394.1 hypothetical protein CN180_25555 [Sinorhizobium medicae]WRQ72089.1 ThiF family adenylyltransferase [Sinorhizobium meliloti]
MIELRHLQPGMVPHWEHAWKGRFDFELRDIAAFVGDTLRIDDKQLRDGILRLEFDWPLSDGRLYPLQASFPDSFPFVRPQVALRGDPSSFPEKHCSPADGTLCLLGRDTGLWSAEWTLATLLEKQLENALNGTGLEDPQAEPIEVWWNALAPNFEAFVEGSYVLVDSAWRLEDAETGVLRLTYSIEKVGEKIKFRGAVDEIKALNGTVLATRDFPLPPDLQAKSHTAAFPWRRTGRFAPPPPGRWRDKEVQDHIAFARRPVDKTSPAISISVTVQATDLSSGIKGDAFLFPLLYGPSKSFRDPKPGQAKVTKPSIAIIPTYRAGEMDVGFRVPSTKILRDRTVAVFGLGAIGAPVAIELARSGCNQLVVVDHDIVEPGNSIRWPLGSTAWGTLKTTAIKQHVEAQYPWVSVESHRHFLGMPTADEGNGDHSVLPPIIARSDLIIDATASPGISRLLADCCKRAEKPLISVFGTLSLRGGVVAYYHPKSGCPTCREFAYQKGVIEKAPGSGESSGLRQPPGCAELTFTGASFDLQELSLESVRLAVDVLSQPDEFNGSVIHTLSLHDGTRRVPPLWRVDELQPAPECRCNT